MKRLCVIVTLLTYSQLPLLGQRLVPPKNKQSNQDDDDQELRQALSKNENEEAEVNSTEYGVYLGAPCDSPCNPKLLHVNCNLASGFCECEKGYPVRLNLDTGCAKPKRLGDQCYYKETCVYTDSHSSCLQKDHNAICQCESGYRMVTVTKPTKRVFCAEDVDGVSPNVSSFAGVLSGIALITGLICFVLRLFNNQNQLGNKRHRFGNANLAPPILFSSDPGSLPMPVYERSMTSRTSSRRTLASLPSRRASSAQGCRGVYGSRAGAARTAAILLLSYSSVPFEVDPARSGSRRPSLTSVHSTSSLKSYSARRYEREREQKEEREMQRRLARMTSQSVNSVIRIAPTPSPKSTDELLPTLEEDKQIPPLAIQEEASTSFHEDMPSTSQVFL